MAEYAVRPGIILLKIQNVYLLCADRNARQECRYVCEINSTAASVWKLLAEGYNTDDIITRMSSEYEIDDADQLRKDVIGFIDSLIKNRYLTRISTSEL